MQLSVNSQTAMFSKNVGHVAIPSLFEPLFKIQCIIIKNVKLHYSILRYNKYYLIIL